MKKFGIGLLAGVCLISLSGCVDIESEATVNTDTTFTGTLLTTTDYSEMSAFASPPKLSELEKAGAVVDQRITSVDITWSQDGDLFTQTATFVNATQEEISTATAYQNPALQGDDIPGAITDLVSGTDFPWIARVENEKMIVSFAGIGNTPVSDPSASPSSMGSDRAAMAQLASQYLGDSGFNLKLAMPGPLESVTGVLADDEKAVITAGGSEFEIAGSYSDLIQTYASTPDLSGDEALRIVSSMDPLAPGSPAILLNEIPEGSETSVTEESAQDSSSPLPVLLLILLAVVAGAGGFMYLRTRSNSTSQEMERDMRDEEYDDDPEPENNGRK